MECLHGSKDFLLILCQHPPQVVDHSSTHSWKLHYTQWKTEFLHGSEDVLPYPLSTSATGCGSFQHTFRHIEKKITLYTVKDGISSWKRGCPPLSSVNFNHKLYIIPAHIPAYREEKLHWTQWKIEFIHGSEDVLFLLGQLLPQVIDYSGTHSCI